MYIANVTVYDNMTDEYKNTLSLNYKCTNIESNIDMFIPSLFSTIPCGLSFLCMLSLMICTLNKH